MGNVICDLEEVELSVIDPFDAPVPLLFSSPANLVARNKHCVVSDCIKAQDKKIIIFSFLALNTCSKDGTLCAPFEYLKSPQRYHI